MLVVSEVDRPQPKDDEILVRFHASTVNSSDWFIRGAEVTAVCGPNNAELVRSLGADHVFDYSRMAALPEGERYDLVLDTVGKRKTSALRTACEHALHPGGRVLSVDDGTPQLLPSDLGELKDLAERGVLKPIIDRRYPLEDIVEAHRYVEQEHKKGNVIISIIATNE